jgi:cell division protein FtsZ
MEVNLYNNVMAKKINKKIKDLPASRYGSNKKAKVLKPVKNRKVLSVKIKAKKRKIKSKPKIVKKTKIVKKVLKTVITKKNDQQLGQQITAFPAEALFKAKIKVIGIGGGGGSIVSEIGKSLQKATFVVADTDVRALKKKSGIKYFLFGEDMTHGLGTGLNVDLAKKAAESAKQKISNIFKDQDIVVFIASLGGGLGSGATQIFAEVAKEFGGITFGIFTMPFKFEGANKYRIAQNALRNLRQSLNVSLVIPNEKIFKVIDTNTAITDAFSMVNKSLVGSLESLIDLIYNPGIINIDFADLRAILKGIGNSAFLNTIEESGKNRAEKICEKILFNPLLQNNAFKAEKILLNIEGSNNLSMLEVEKISKKVSELNPDAKIIFGISKDQKLNNKIKTTILMTGGGEKPEEIKKTEIIEKKIEKVKVLKKIVEKKKVVVKKNKKILKKQPNEEYLPVSVDIPVLPIQPSEPIVLQERRINIIEPESQASKAAIRRSGLEIKKAEELEEKKRQQQEKEWEIPAFLRRGKA